MIRGALMVALTAAPAVVGWASRPRIDPTSAAAIPATWARRGRHPRGRAEDVMSQGLTATPRLGRSPGRERGAAIPSWACHRRVRTGGRLTSIEIDAVRHDLARRHVSEAGLSQRVTLIKGDAHVEVTKLDGPFDFVFLDADKEGQVDYFNKLYPKKLGPGGILAAHNAIQQANSMKDYLDMIRKHPDFDTVTLSTTMEDGFCLSYRHRTL